MRPTREQVEAELAEAIKLIESIRGGEILRLPAIDSDQTINDPSFGNTTFDLGPWTDEQEALEGLRLAVEVAEGQRDALKKAIRRKHEQLTAARERIEELERRIESQGGDWRRRG